MTAKDIANTIIVLVIIALIVGGIAFMIGSFIREYQLHGFCIDHGYSKALFGRFEGLAYCYRLDGGTEILVPIEELE